MRRADAISRFERSFALRLGVSDCVAMSSGRAALYLALRVLASKSTRRVVIVPAYTCYTVPAAVVRAGLLARPCDVDPETLDYDRDALRVAVRDDVLAVVATGLYGVPANLRVVRSAASRHGAGVIDDAAQCFGAAADGRPCGSEGDFGVSSFGRGKGLSTYEGGALVSSDPDGIRSARAMLAAEPAGRVGSVSVALKAAGYSIFQRPRMYGLLRGIPSLKLGASVFDPGFEVAPMGRFQAALGLEALAIVDRVIAAQRQRAAFYLTRLPAITGLSTPRVAEASHPAWLRFPVLGADRGMRDRLFASTSTAGLGVSVSYPRALTQLPQLASELADGPMSCPGAEKVAGTILTLPTHAAVRVEDQERILELAAAAETAPGRVA